MKNLVTFSLILFLSISLNSCASENKDMENKIKEYLPELKIEYVLKTAKKYFKEKGHKIEEYFIKSIKYDSLIKEWTIIFQGKRAVPGNYWVVKFYDRTKRIDLFSGE